MLCEHCKFLNGHSPECPQRSDSPGRSPPELNYVTFDDICDRARPWYETYFTPPSRFEIPELIEIRDEPLDD